MCVQLMLFNSLQRPLLFWALLTNWMVILTTRASAILVDSLTQNDLLFAGSLIFDRVVW